MGTSVMKSWQDTWTAQLQKQAQLTDAEEVASKEALSTEQKAHWTKALSKPRPEFDEGEEEGIPQLVTCVRTYLGYLHPYRMYVNK